MSIIFLIAADNIRALLHQRLLLGLMLATLALTIFFSITLSSARKNITTAFSDESVLTNGIPGNSHLSPVEQKQFHERMESASTSLQAGFYALSSFGGSIVALFIFSTAVSSEIRKGTIRLTLSKPVTRTQFLLGNYLGGVAVMAGYAILTSLALAVFASTQSVELIPAIKWAPWLMFCRQLMLGSLALLLSLFVHPVIAAVLAFFAGNGLCSPPNPLYFILPSYQDFNIFFSIIQGTLIKPLDIFFLSLYAADFVIVMLVLAWWRFRKKELV